jgi:RNA polymerase sigma factor (sigma-70 family)
VEASALRHQSAAPSFGGRSPLLRLQGDDKLIALTRRGNQAAFEALVQRYQARLLAFCRHMLGSKEDAEDVLQEVFAAAYNALMADQRRINTRPWLYRIARNRCLNHLRKPRPTGQDSMDIFERDGGTSAADTVHRREEFRQIVADVGGLPETQRTALLLREIDALSYDQISEAMDTTVASVKSLLVRARVSLAEAAEARLLTCAEVRLELGQVAEGLARTSAPVRKHLKGCDRCDVFRGELRKTNKALAAISPLGPLALVLNKVGLAKLGLGGATAGGAAASGGSGAIAGGAGLAAGGAAAASGGATVAGGAISAGIGTITAKAAAGVAAAAIVTAGAVEVQRSATPAPPPEQQVAAVAAHPVPAAPADSATKAAGADHGARRAVAKPVPAPARPGGQTGEPAAEAKSPPAPATVPAEAPTATEETLVHEEEGTVVLPPDHRRPDPPTLDPVAQPPPPVVVPPPGAPTGPSGGATAPPATTPPPTTPPPATAPAPTEPAPTTPPAGTQTPPAPVEPVEEPPAEPAPSGS